MQCALMESMGDLRAHWGSAQSVAYLEAQPLACPVKGQKGIPIACQTMIKIVLLDVNPVTAILEQQQQQDIFTSSAGVEPNCQRLVQE